MYLTPQAKKQRVDAYMEEEDVDSDLDDDDDQRAERWMKEQQEMKAMMKKMMGMVENIQSNVEDLKCDAANMKLQINMAQQTAEEALEISKHIEERVRDLEENALDKSFIENIVDKYLATHTDRHKASKFPVTNPTIDKNMINEEDKFSRTVVIGGFQAETQKKIVVDFMNTNILKDVSGVDEAYAYSFGSVGFLRFVTKDDMWSFIKAWQTREKPKFNGKYLWASTSKSPAERIKAKNLSKFKRVLVEVGLANATDIRIDYRRGFAFVKHVKVANWNANSEKLSIDQGRLKEAGVDIEVKKVEDAVDELVGQ